MRAAVTMLLVLTGVTLLAAVQTNLDLPAVSEAVALGRVTGPARARFHNTYRAILATAPVDTIDIVTPFRRIVLASQARMTAGDRSFGQRQALEILSKSGDQLDVHVELTFHPLNTFVGVPAYHVHLAVQRGPALQPASIDRIPRWTPRMDGALPETPSTTVAGAARGQPLLGGTLIAHFNLREIDPRGTYDVVIDGEGGEIGRATMKLESMR